MFAAFLFPPLFCVLNLIVNLCGSFCSYSNTLNYYTYAVYYYNFVSMSTHKTIAIFRFDESEQNITVQQSNQCYFYLFNASADQNVMHAIRCCILVLGSRSSKNVIRLGTVA